MSEIENKNKKEYEMAYLLTPEIAEEKLDLETSELQKIISENGGEIVELVAPKKRRLAYSIQKQNQAYFGVVYFNISSEGIDKIKKSLMLNKKIIRYLILNEILRQKPVSAPVKSSEEQIPTQSFEKKLESILNR